MDSEWMQENAKRQTLEGVRILFHVLASTFLLLWADFVPQLEPNGYDCDYMYLTLNKVIVIVVQTKIELYWAHSSSMAQQSPKIKIPRSTPAFTWLLLIHFPFAVRISVLKSWFFPYGSVRKNLPRDKLLVKMLFCILVIVVAKLHASKKNMKPDSVCGMALILSTYYFNTHQNQKL